MANAIANYKAPGGGRRLALEDKRRGTASDRGYDWQWRRFASAYRTRHPLCRVCASADPPRLSPADAVDHIQPLADGGAKYDETNLQPICAVCHAMKDGGRRNP